MGAGFQLRIQDVVYSEATLLGPMPHHLAASHQFSSAWQFCHSWLCGQEEFELRTSGSTGTPKTIRARRSQFEASAGSTGRHLGYRQGERSLLCISAAFVGGTMVLVRGLVFGFEVVVTEPSASPAEGLPEDLPIHHLSLAPIQLEGFLHALPRHGCLKGLKTVLVGGADVKVDLRHMVAGVVGPKVFLTFGMTETLSHFALKQLNPPADRYEAFDGVRLSLSPARELIVDWPGVTDGPVHTHDLADLHSAGSFEWRGRTDFTINSGGIKIQPEVVEEEAKVRLFEMEEGCPDLVVIGVPDLRLGQKALLVIEGSPLSKEAILGLDETLVATLPRYHAPKGYYALPEFPRTKTGKPDRAAILARLQSKIGLDPGQPA